MMGFGRIHGHGSDSRVHGDARVIDRHFATSSKDRRQVLALRGQLYFSHGMIVYQLRGHNVCHCTELGGTHLHGLRFIFAEVMGGGMACKSHHRHSRSRIHPGQGHQWNIICGPNLYAYACNGRLKERDRVHDFSVVLFHIKHFNAAIFFAGIGIMPAQLYAGDVGHRCTAHWIGARDYRRAESLRCTPGLLTVLDFIIDILEDTEQHFVDEVEGLW
mmetsp:Transcript_12845/g.23311  ORF Transcript_12845/g.23311 Transcript_12845/m.23311 type:complete len:217 (+) Transcript_12845:2443-3093(+)